MITAQTRKNDKLIIRPVEPGDIASILDIDRRISGRKRSITYGHLLNEDVGGELNMSTIAEIKGKAVGFILARHSYVGDPVKEAGLIQIIGVDPDYWGQGIGTMLIKALEANCRSKGIKRICTMVKHRDGQLRKFFEIVGYEAGQLIDYNKVIK